MNIKSKIKNAVACCILSAAAVFAGHALAADGYSPFSAGSSSQQKSSSAAYTDPARYQTKNVLSFGEAQSSDATGPFAGSEAQMEELDKLQPIIDGLQGAIDAHNTLNGLKNYRDTQRRYNEMVQLHEKSIEVLKQSEQCVINYIGRYFNNPVSVWSGVDLRDTPQSHDLRKGLSAWALETYETAKAAQLSPIDVGDVSTLDMDALSKQSEAYDKKNEALSGEMISVEGTENATANMSDAETLAYADQNDGDTALDIEGKKDSVKELSNQHDGIFFKEPDKQEAYEEDSRKSDLLPTDIGAEASISLASNPAKWGSIKKEFPIWNDQKTFYNQYLDGKYLNIAQYIKNLEISADAQDKIYNALLQDQASFMAKAEKEITQAAMAAVTKTNQQYESEYHELEEKYNTNVNAAVSKAKADVSALENERDGKSARIDSEIASLQAQRTSYAQRREELIVSNEELSKLISETKQELSAAESLTAGAEMTDEQKKEHEELVAELKGEITAAQAKIQAQNQEKASVEAAYDQKTREIETKTKAKNDLLTEYSAKIANVNKAAEAQKTALKAEFDKQDQANRQKRDDKIKKINLAAEAAKKTLDTNSGVTVKDIVNTTNLIIAIAKDDAVKNIEKVRQAFYGLGDDLYRGSKQDKVVEYHQALIENLRGKNVNLDGIELEGVGGKVRGVTTELETIVSGKDLENSLNEMYVDLRSQYIKNTNVMLNVSLFDDVLKNMDTSADSEFFVGAVAKERDFKAPRIMPDFDLPPLREYVHFDYIDLKNAVGDAQKMIVGKDIAEELFPGFPDKGTSIFFKQTESIPLSVVNKNTFLNYGGRIPEIWKLMLQDKAFVETDFFLSSALAPEDRNIEKDALKLGGETLALFRGGIYPCVVKNISNCKAPGMIENGEGIVDVAYNSKGEYHANEYMMGLSFVKGERRQALLDQNLPVCQNVSAACSRFKPSSPYFITSKGEGQIKLTELSDKEYSELGTILALNSGKIGNERVYNLLTLTPEMESLLVYGQRMEAASKDENMPELNAVEKINDDIYKDAQYRNNQIGDFLVQAETEQTYKNSVEELKTSIDQMREDLLEVLRGMGFAPSEDFDISKDSDYDLAVSKLKSVKQNYLNTVGAKISSINDAGSELLRDSKRNYSAVYNALEQDKDAVTTMGMAIADSTTLDETIKTGKANLAVDSTYQETADKSFEEQLNSFNPAYCVAY